MNTSNKILVAVDFTENPEDILSRALLLHPKSDSEIILLHVIEDHQATSIYTGTATPWRDLQRNGIANAKKSIQKYVDSLASKFPRVTPLVRVGDVAELIVRTAEEQNVECIIVGEHCRSGLGHWFHRNVAEHVLRSAKRDVLSFHVPA